MPKGVSIIHLVNDELGLPSVICTTLYGIGLVSLVLYASIPKGYTSSSQCYMHQSSRDKCNLSNAICINLQWMYAIGLSSTNNNIM